MSALISSIMFMSSVVSTTPSKPQIKNMIYSTTSEDNICIGNKDLEMSIHKECYTYNNNANALIINLNDKKAEGCINKTVYTDNNIGVVKMDTKLTDNLNRLLQIKDLVLESNKEEIRFSKMFIDSLTNMLFKLKYQPDIFPNFLGNIQLEYEDEHKYLEINITPDLFMSIFKIDEEGNEYETNEYTKLDIDKINKELESFHGQ